MTVISAEVVTTKFLFGMCDYTVNSDVGSDDFSLVLGILHVRTIVRIIDVPIDFACANNRTNNRCRPENLPSGKPEPEVCNYSPTFLPMYNAKIEIFKKNVSSNLFVFKKYQ